MTFIWLGFTRRTLVFLCSENSLPCFHTESHHHLSSELPLNSAIRGASVYFGVAFYSLKPSSSETMHLSWLCLIDIISSSFILGDKEMVFQKVLVLKAQ